MRTRRKRVTYRRRILYVPFTRDSLTNVRRVVFFRTFTDADAQQIVTPEKPVYGTRQR